MGKTSPVIIGLPVVEDGGDAVRVRSTIRGLAAPELRFEVDAAHARFLDDGCDTAVASVLIAAIHAGKAVHVAGPVSEKLLWGLLVLRVVSNQHRFYSPIHNHRLSWLGTITVRNAALPPLLQAGVRRFLFASSHSWREIGVGTFRDVTRMDPILLPALSTERVELLSVGAEHTQVEKSRRIARLEVVWEHLDVCILKGDTNCPRCEKCLRTLLTLELLGQLDAFAGRFDLDD